jgi:hypothetical protein
MEREQAVCEEDDEMTRSFARRLRMTGEGG